MLELLIKLQSTCSTLSRHDRPVNGPQPLSLTLAGKWNHIDFQFQIVGRNKMVMIRLQTFQFGLSLH